MSTHTEHTKHHPSTLQLWWLSGILLILTNTGHARQHIAMADADNPGVYHTFGDFITNTPDNDRAVVFDHEKGKLYYKDTGKKMRSRSAYGFCKDGQTYNSYTKEDTIRAVNHLFRRKRSGGTTRGVIGGVFLGATLGQLASGNSTSNAAGNAIYLIVFGGLAASGIVQVSQYSEERLNRIVTEYREQGILPLRIIKKLKKKDFRQKRGRTEKPGGTPQG